MAYKKNTVQYEPLGVVAALVSWRLVAYRCIGRPAADADTPEHERAGWERRQPSKIL